MKYSRQIFEFKKTNHCLERQWKRQIDDFTLEKILRYHQKGDTHLIATSTFLYRKGVLKAAHANDAIVIIIENNRLILTCFFCYDYRNFIQIQKNQPKRVVHERFIL